MVKKYIYEVPRFRLFQIIEFRTSFDSNAVSWRWSTLWEIVFPDWGLPIYERMEVMSLNGCFFQTRGLITFNNKIYTREKSSI